MQESDDDFFIIGHRGVAGERFENSLDGFTHALTLDIDAIELDIREHNGTLWVFHDHETERLTGQPGLFASQIDIGTIKLNNGEPVPSLKQVLDLYWGKMPINIEIKFIVNPGLLLNLLAQYPTLQASTGLPWILISSFNHQNILELKQLGCRWPLALLSTGIPIHVDHVINDIAPYSWHFNDEYVDFDFIAQLGRKKVRSLVFTVDNVDRARLLRKHGVAGIITNFPAEMSLIN